MNRSYIRHTIISYVILKDFVGEHDGAPIMDPFGAVLPPDAPLSLSPTCTIPCRDDFPGPLNFEIFLDSTSAHRKSWIVSNFL